jgi:hypothetical protein
VTLTTLAKFALALLKNAPTIIAISIEVAEYAARKKAQP